MRKIDYTEKNIFWRLKKRSWATWNTGHVFKEENGLIQIGNDDNIVEQLYHSNWYSINELEIKVRKP